MGLGALEPRIEIETQLARQCQVRPLPRCGYDAIDRADPARAVGRGAFDYDASARFVDRDDSESRQQCYTSAIHQRPHIRTEFATRR